MSTQTPVAPPTAPTLRVAEPPPPGRRHWVLALVLVLVVALLAGGVAAGVYVVRYQPLCTTFSCSGVSGVHGPTVRSNRSTTDPEGESFTAAVVTHQVGRTFTYEFTLTNQGRHPVTVTAIGAGPGSWYRLWSPVQVTMAPDIGNGPARPFRPFVLSARNPMDISVTDEMRGCITANSSSGFGSIPITYRYLGFTHHTRLLLPFSISVVGARGENCS